jgi:hypothetical protein
MDELVGIEVEFHHRSCKVGAGSQQALVQVSNWTCGRIQPALDQCCRTAGTSHCNSCHEHIHTEGRIFPKFSPLHPPARCQITIALDSHGSTVLRKKYLEILV